MLKRLLLLLACWSSAASAATPAETVDAFHRALREGDGANALAYLDKNVSIFEQGFAESSRDDWARSQLKDAAEFARQTTRRILRRESGMDSNSAWVLSMTLTEGQFGDRKLALVGSETMLLRREGEGWLISHIHWSAHPSEEAPPAAPAP